MINSNGCKDIIPWYVRSAFNERFENKLLDRKSLPRNDFFVLTIKHRNETTRRLIPNSKSGKRATPLSQSFSHRVKSTRWHRKFHYFMITVKHASRRAIHLNGTTCLKYVIVKLDTNTADVLLGRCSSNFELFFANVCVYGLKWSQKKKI